MRGLYTSYVTERLGIQHIKFKAGGIPGAAGLDIDIPHVTIFVGRNNSGKSQALREIEAWCHGSDPSFQIIDEITLDLPNTAQEIVSMLRIFRAKPPPDCMETPETFWIARPAIRQGEEPIHQEIAVNFLGEYLDEEGIKTLRKKCVRMYTLRVDGRTRFDLVEPKEAGALEESPRNHLWALFTNDESRKKMRAFSKKAFDKYVVIDPTGMKQFRFRLSDREQKTNSEERGLDEEALIFHQNATLISDLGDGVQA